MTCIGVRSGEERPSFLSCSVSSELSGFSKLFVMLTSMLAMLYWMETSKRQREKEREREKK